VDNYGADVWYCGAFEVSEFCSLQGLLVGLRQCVLEFTQRLHRAEVDRHDLYSQISRRHNGLVDMCSDVDRSQADRSQVLEAKFSLEFFAFCALLPSPRVGPGAVSKRGSV